MQVGSRALESDQSCVATVTSSHGIAFINMVDGDTNAIDRPLRIWKTARLLSHGYTKLLRYLLKKASLERVLRLRKTSGRRPGISSLKMSACDTSLYLSLSLSPFIQ